jgi:hypothetical protein
MRSEAFPNAKNSPGWSLYEQREYERGPHVRGAREQVGLAALRPVVQREWHSARIQGATAPGGKWRFAGKGPGGPASLFIRPIDDSRSPSRSTYVSAYRGVSARHYSEMVLFGCITGHRPLQGSVRGPGGTREPAESSASRRGRSGEGESNKGRERITTGPRAHRLGRIGLGVWVGLDLLLLLLLLAGAGKYMRAALTSSESVH